MGVPFLYVSAVLKNRSYSIHINNCLTVYHRRLLRYIKVIRIPSKQITKETHMFTHCCVCCWPLSCLVYVLSHLIYFLLTLNWSKEQRVIRSGWGPSYTFHIWVIGICSYLLTLYARVLHFNSTLGPQTRKPVAENRLSCSCEGRSNANEGWQV